MSTVVCQGFQPFPEPQPIETKTLSLKLALPKPCFFDAIGLARGPCSNLNQEALEGESSYFHPMMKRSSSMLSDKSLELCTENLGSETGTDTIESTIFSLSSSPDLMGGDQTPARELPKSREINLESRRVMNSNRNFPPPLTTISGSSSLQVRPHREGGRLIIKAVEASSPHTYLQAERIHGRLRLCFALDSEMGAEENEESDMEELENEAYDEEEEGEEDDDEGGEGEESEGYVREDMDGNSLDVGVEMGMEKFQRPTRCKESGPAGNKSLCNWEPFWVATS